MKLKRSLGYAKARAAVAALVVSGAGLVGIVSWEGYRSTAYTPVPGDVPTIGFGTTEGVKPGDKITPEVALARALRDVNKFEGAIKQCVKVPLHQHEYDAYTSFAYNVGVNAFCSSTLIKLLNAEDYAGACAQLSRWVYGPGGYLQGLANRRAQERARCEGRL